MQGACVILEWCCSFPLPSFETQRNGLVFIYDMAGSQYTNFELDLSKKILNLLKVVAAGMGWDRMGWSWVG